MEWIKISETKPPESGYYLITMFSHYKHKSFSDYGYYDKGAPCWYQSDEQLDGEYEVTHWMKLPEPPK